MRNKALWLLTALLLVLGAALAACTPPAETPPAQPPTQFTVTFDSRGGSAVSAAEVKENAAVEKPADPTRAGYEFQHWSETEDGAAYDFSKPITANKTLYAVWKQVFTVTFDSRGGSAVSSETVLSGERAAVPEEDPVRYGFDFLYWSETEDGNAYDFSKPITANKTLYAVWRQYFTVTFVWFEGKEVPMKVYADLPIEAPAEDPVRENHDFVRWSAEEDGETAFAFGECPASDTTVYAVWKRYFTVRYLWADGNGTQFLPARKVYAGECAEDVRTVEHLQYATQAYYWYVSDRENPTQAEVTERFDFSEPVTEDVDLYTFAGERTSWTFPEEAGYDASNPWGMETMGQTVTEEQASVALTEEGLRFRVAADPALNHSMMLQSSNMGQVSFDPAAMKNLTIRYKNFGADTVLRLIVIGTRTAGGALEQLHAFNYGGLEANMTEADDWAEYAVDLSDMAGNLVYLRMEFVSSAADAFDANGTDILIESIRFTA